MDKPNSVIKLKQLYDRCNIRMHLMTSLNNMYYLFRYFDYWYTRVVTLEFSDEINWYDWYYDSHTLLPWQLYTTFAVICWLCTSIATTQYHGSYTPSWQSYTAKTNVHYRGTRTLPRQSYSTMATLYYYSNCTQLLQLYTITSTIYYHGSYPPPRQPYTTIITLYSAMTAIYYYKSIIQYDDSHALPSQLYPLSR